MRELAYALFFIFFCTWPSLAQTSQQVKARYVHVELPGAERTLSLAEVEVYSGVRNVALHGTATQSSTHRDAVAARANDGNGSGHYFGHSVSSTQSESHPWWKLDLGSEQTVSRLIIHNRTDCCRDRINPARILLINETGQIVWEGTIKSAANKYEFDINRPHDVPITPNLLRNAAFRQRTNPPIPDFWDLHHVAALTFKNLHDQYGVDESIDSPVAGTRVLKITNSEDNFSHLMLMPRKQFARLAAGYHTFSVYLKSDGGGTEFRVTPAFGSGDPTVHRLSPTWRRYSVTFRFSGSASDSLQPVLSFPQKGTYYVAAPQLERGKMPSPFQEAYDDSNPKKMQTAMQQETKGLSDTVNKALSNNANTQSIATFEYNYYTDDPFARLKVASGLDSAVTAQISCTSVVNGELWFQAPKKQSLAPRASIYLDIPIRDLPTGNYTCAVETVGSRTKRTLSATELRKLAPNSVEVRINNFRRIIAINNQPFHVIGMGVGSWKIPPDWYFADLVSHGINTVFCTFPIDAKGKLTSSVESFLSSAARHGLKVIVGIPLAGAKQHDWHERFQAFSTLIARIKYNPVVIGWWPVDEPAAGSWKDEELLEIYKVIKRIDPYRLVFVNWAYDGVPSAVGMEPRGTLKSTDLYSIDYYPITGQRSSMEGFRATTVRMALTSRLYNKIPHSWIQLYGGGDAWREPTGDEINSMVYLNLIFGGMTSYWDTKSNSKTTWERLAVINKQAKTLAETLFLNADAQQIRHPRISNGFFYAVWKNGKSLYVIVLNSGTERGAFELDTHDLLRHHRPYADSLFEKRKISLESGHIKDEFGPLESRVYVIENE